jgi:hypothetical protein
VDFDRGSFTVYLGDAGDLDLELFRDHGGVFLAVTIDGEEFVPRFELGSVPFAAYSEFSGDAATFDGLDPEDFSFADHGHPWGDLSDIPADLADGDDGESYAAGTGLTLNEATNTFAVDRDMIEDWARGECYDTEAELTSRLDDNYLSSLGVGCDEGDVYTWTGADWECAPVSAASTDADTLDGLHSAAFARSTHSHGPGGSAAPWTFHCTTVAYSYRCPARGDGCVLCTAMVSVDGPAVIMATTTGTVTLQESCIWLEIDNDVIGLPCSDEAPARVAEITPRETTGNGVFAFSTSRYVIVDAGEHRIESHIYCTIWGDTACTITRAAVQGVVIPLY